jgi:tellurite resistance protein
MADKPFRRFFDNIEQLDIFARGLFHLACVDGIVEEERAVIREFLEDMGEPDLMESLDKVAFDPRMLALALETTNLRRLFLKTGLLLVYADGVFSAEEREAIDLIAEVLGLTRALPEIESEMKDVSL